jgi:ABC-type transport system involved in cytochrome c biogenesis ATPase subunit
MPGTNIKQATTALRIMINSLDVENFTVFKSAHFDFVPGINVFVGANATGKTHLLKLLYVFQVSQMREARSPGFGLPHEQLLGVFKPEHMSDVVRKGGGDAKLQAEWNGTPLTISLFSLTGLVGNVAGPWPNVTPPAFIPEKDMLANSVGFMSLVDRREIDFDDTYRDILSLALVPKLRQLNPPDYVDVLNLLAEQMEGTVDVQGERFYLVTKDRRLEMHTVASGWRKLALLYLLIANGSIQPGTILYWDEPETNLNPSIMRAVVEVLLMIARRGTQIFLATHSYMILKELELQKTDDDSLQLFSMERNKRDGSVTPNPAQQYLDLKPNLIADEFERIYDLDINRSLGRF